MGPEFQFMRALAGAAKFFKAAKVAFYIYAGVSAVKSWREASALMKEGQDVLATKHPAGGKLPILYGTRRVGSTIVYMDTDSGNSKELFVVYALSVGEIDDIDLGSIELNGVSIRDSKVFRQGYYAGSDKIVSGAGSLNTASQIGNVQESNAGTSGTDPTKRYRMVFNAHHGSSTQTADPMLTASITKWTTSHRLRGIAYIAASFEYDSRGMFTSTPELTVVCRGKKLYDPRLDGSISGGTGSHRIDDTSTYEWSDNAALAILDYITNTEYGKGLAASAIDMGSFQAAANITDTKVDVPDFSGSYASATYTGNSGNNYFDVDEATWKKIKGGSVITLKDSDTTTELEDAIVTDVQRYTPHTETTKYRIYTNSTLGANYSNEAGTILVKTRRFHCNGLLDADKTVLENTRTLVSNCRAFFNYLNGKFSIKIEDTGSSTFSITEDHIVDDSGITINYEDKAEKYNKVVVNFFNAQKKYEADTVTIYHDASPNYTSDDGGEELEAQAELNFVTNPYIAYNIGKAILGRSRNQKAISFTATPALFRLSVGDIVDITYSGLGLSADNYIIQSISLEANGLLNVTALEYVDIYTWDSASDAENVGDLPDLPTGLEAIPPTNLTFTDSDSSSTGRPFLSWTAATNYPAKEFRVVIVDSSDNELHNRIVSNAFIDLNFIPVGSNYEASVSSINSLGSESDAATLTFSVGTEPVATTDVQDSAVTTGKINDSAVTTGKINDSAVTSGKLADGAVTSLKLADDAVTNAKLAVDSIQGDVIAAGAITTTKLADDAVTNAKIAVDAIQGDVIAAGAITTTKLGANAVTTAKLANDAVTSDIIAASAVTTTEISDNAVSTAKLIAGSVTTAKIATGAVTANEIAANTITAGEIAAGAINTDELAANAVTAAKIAANTITASQIAAGTITATQIATDTITAANIAAGAINTSELAANAVTAAKIAANTITASQIAAGTITTTQIAAGTIAASNIATGTLTSASGVFGAISAGDISTGSLTSTNHSGTGDGSDFSTAGTKINIADGSVSSENFRISSAGDAFFRGQVTAGSGVSTVAIGADSGSNINIFAGATTPDSATFKVDSTGKVTLTSLILKTGGNTYFDENGFTDYAITQILQGTGTTVGSYAYSQSDNTSYATITTTDAVTVDLTASLDMSQILGDNSYSTSALAKAQIPEDMTLIIEVAEDDNTFGSPLHGSTSSQFTADTTGVFQPDPSDGSGVTSSEYHVSAFGFFGVYTASISPTFGAVDSNSNMSISLNNVSLSANTTYYFRFRLTTTDTNYDLENNLTIPTATRTLNIAAQSGGFVVASGGGSGSGTSADSFQRISVSGQSTIIADATNSNNLTIAAGSGIALTTNASTDTLTIAASGSPTFTDLTVTGNLTVQGTTTTLETATLNVEDKNITLNYGTGDTSASANGAGITIQDAVNSTTDATILWNTTSDEFDFSHGIDVSGAIAVTTANDQILTLNQSDSSTWNYIGFAIQGTRKWYTGIDNGGQYVIGSDASSSVTFSGITALKIGTTTFIDSSLNLSNIGTISSGAITSSGNVTATAFYGDGSNLTGITGTATTINNNADNRIITGSGTANTLNAESGLTYDGSTLAVTGTISSGVIDSSGTSNFDSIQLTDASRLGFGTVKSGATVGHNASVDEGIFWHTDNNYGIYRTAGAWSSPNYSQLKIKWHTGIEIDGHGTTYGKSGINFLNGNIQMDGIQILDASRNLLNIGTISSGAITAPSINNTATITFNSTGNNPTVTLNRYSGQPSLKAGTDDGGYLIMDSSGSLTALNWYTSDPVVLALGGGNVGIGDNTPSQRLDVSGNIGISGTEIITSSRNLTNIASANIGGGTSYFSEKLLVSGRTRVAGQLDISLGSGYSNYGTLYHDDNNFTIGMARVAGTGNIVLSPYANVNIGSGGLQIGGTTVIDSSRNLTNIGTISSGAITATGNSRFIGITSGGYALEVLRGSDSARSLSVLNTGEVLVENNYFYVAASQGSYFQNAVRFRGTISNDTGTYVTFGQAISVSGAITTSGSYTQTGGTFSTAGASTVTLTDGYERVKINGHDFLGYPSGSSLWMLSNVTANSSNKAELVLGTEWDWDDSCSFQYIPAASGSSGGALRIGQQQKNSASWNHTYVYFYMQGADRFYFDWNGVGYATGDYRAPLFYDYNDTAWYLNPNSDSRLNNVTLNNALVLGAIEFNDGYAGSFSQGSKPYEIYMDSRSWTHPYPDLNIAMHTGICFGANQSYEGIRFFTDYNMSTRTLYINYGSSNFIRKDVWLETDTTGMYSGTNSFHIEPNTLSTYGSGAIRGSKNSYGGFYDSFSGNNIGMYDSGGNGGEFRQGVRWITYFHVSNACLGIGGSTTSSSYGLYEQMGGIYSTGNITAYSDRRVKENIVPIDNALAKVNALQGVYYNRIDDEDKKKEIGFIAQDVNEVTPELVTYAEDVDQYGVKYGNTTALLVEAIKELTKEVEELKAKLKEK